MGNLNVTKNIKQKYSTVYLSNSNTQGSPQSSLNKLSQKTGTIEINSFTERKFLGQHLSSLQYILNSSFYSVQKKAPKRIRDDIFSRDTRFLFCKS